MGNEEQNKFLKIFEDTGALLNGHFILTSGRHSDKYFQCAKVLQYPQHTETICKEIAEYFKDFEFDTVIAPAMGGIIVGQEVARQMGKRSIFAERKTEALEFRRGFSLEKGEKVLVCEDVVTTGGSVFELINLIKNTGAEIVGVGFIVDRSNGKIDFNYPQKSVFQMEVTSYPPNDVPEWLQKTPVIKPGSRK